MISFVVVAPGLCNFIPCTLLLPSGARHICDLYNKNVHAASSTNGHLVCSSNILNRIEV